MNQKAPLFLLNLFGKFEREVSILGHDDVTTVLAAGGNSNRVGRRNHNELGVGTGLPGRECSCDSMIAGADGGNTGCQLFLVERADGRERSARFKRAGVLQKFEFAEYACTVVQLIFNASASNCGRSNDRRTQRLAQRFNSLQVWGCMRHSLSLSLRPVQFM